jgi:hypothetical protein
MLRCGAVLEFLPWFTQLITPPIIKAHVPLTRVEQTNLVLRPTHYLGHLWADVVFEVPCNVAKSAIAVNGAEFSFAVEVESNVHPSLYWSCSASRPHNEHVLWDIAYRGPSRRLEIDIVAIGWVFRSKLVNTGNEIVLSGRELESNAKHGL